MTVLSGVLVLVIYVIVVVGIGFLVKKSSNKSVDEFLLSGRKAGLLQSGFSIAATWIWAPALFVSAQLAYVNGFTGWLWFTVPNVLILVVFGMVASKLYKNFPKLVTLPQYMNNTYSKRVHVLYIFQFAVNQICSFGVQLIAGGAAVTFLTGIPFYYVIPVLAITAFIYSYIGGFRASLVTDFVQMSLLLLIGFVSVFFVFRSFGFSSVIDGLGGISGEFRNPFNAVGRKLALTMGIGTALGILAGPFGDQTYYQRVFAQPHKNGKKSFLIGGLTFLPIPILFGILGFSAAGIGMVESNVAMINVALINLIESPFLVSLILLGLLCGLGSTMDSNLLAGASMIEYDFNFSHTKILGKSVSKETASFFWMKAIMVILMVLGVVIAFIPNIQILHLFLFYMTLRATTVLPTILSIKGKRRESSMFYGILIGILFGAPLFALGQFLGIWEVSLTGNIIAVGVPGLIVWLRK